MAVIHYKRGREIAHATRRAFLACPSGSGEWCAPFLAAMFESVSALEHAGIMADLGLEAGNVHVDDARNSLVRQFMLTDCTHLVFLDADVGWRSRDLIRLMQHSRSVVAGVYPLKDDALDFPVLVPDGAIWADGEGLVEVPGAPTGFLCIAREVFVQLMATHEDRAFMGRTVAEGSAPYYPLFERGVFDGKRRSGDYAFCAKWRALGGKVYVDPEMVFTHTGPKSWGGCLGDYWRKRAGIESPALGVAIERLKAGDGGHETFCELYAAWGNPGFSAHPDALMTAYRLAKRARGPILETGSGLTTIVMAIAAAHAGQELQALECDLSWWRKVTRTLDRHGLSAIVHYAPLDPITGWYAYASRMMPAEYAVVVCDGPNREHSREGLFRIVSDEIAGADWMIDDADDAAQAQIIAAYSAGRDVHILGADGQKQFALAFAPRAEPMRATA